MAAVSCCDWSSTTCFVQWALGASWACTRSTFLKRKWGGGKNTKGESEFTQKQHRNGVVFDIFSTKMSKQYS